FYEREAMGGHGASNALYAGVGLVVMLDAEGGDEADALMPELGQVVDCLAHGLDVVAADGVDPPRGDLRAGGVEEDHGGAAALHQGEVFPDGFELGPDEAVEAAIVQGFAGAVVRKLGADGNGITPRECRVGNAVEEVCEVLRSIGNPGPVLKDQADGF